MSPRLSTENLGKLYSPIVVARQDSAVDVEGVVEGGHVFGDVVVEEPVALLTLELERRAKNAEAV